MIGAILYRQIWNKLNLTRKLQDFQQAGKTRHDLAEAIFYMTVARSLMPDSGLAQWNKHNTFLYSGARLQLRHHLRALNELLPHKQELLAYLNRQMEKHFDRTVNTAPCVVTTCRFDARDADTLRTFDSDRNNKDNQVQVTMTILIDQTGIPIDYDLFHGEASEPESLSLFLDQMTTKYGIGQVFVMADRDPNSDTSLQQILDLGPEFVINVQRAEGNPKADENRIDAGSLFDRHGEMRHRLRQTEEWFRISKSLWEAHSDFHRKESRIEAHCLISCLALMLHRLLEKTVRDAGENMTSKQMAEALASAELMEVLLPDGQTFYAKARACGDFERICRAVGLGVLPRLAKSADLNNLATEVGGFRYSRGFSPRGCPRFAVTPTTKSLLTQPLYGKGRNPPPSEPPELALGDPFSGLNDYDTGVKPGCYSG